MLQTHSCQTWARHIYQLSTPQRIVCQSDHPARWKTTLDGHWSTMQHDVKAAIWDGSCRGDNLLAQMRPLETGSPAVFTFPLSFNADNLQGAGEARCPSLVSRLPSTSATKNIPQRLISLYHKHWENQPVWGVCVCDSGVRGESGQFVFKQVYLLDDITRGQGVFVSQKALIKNRSRPAVLLVVLEKNLVEQILHDCGLINMIINTPSLTYNKGKCLLLTIHQNQST